MLQLNQILVAVGFHASTQPTLSRLALPRLSRRGLLSF